MAGFRLPFLQGNTVKRLFFILFFLAFNASASEFCFKDAGDKYHIDPLLLRSIAEVESGLNPAAINLNKKNGKITSTDYGVMQINSAHLGRLKNFGISKNDLLKKPCLNIHVGAWILAHDIAQGGVSWNSIGAYNAGFSGKGEVWRVNYAHKVYHHYKTLLLNERGIDL